MLDKFIEEMKVNRSIITTKGGVKVTFDILDREHGLAFMDSEGARYKCFMFRVNDDETLSVDPQQALKEVGEVLYQVEAHKPKTFIEHINEVGYRAMVGDENGKGKFVHRPGLGHLKVHSEQDESDFCELQEVFNTQPISELLKIEEIRKKLGCKSLSQFAAQVCQSENYKKYEKYLLNLDDWDFMDRTKSLLDSTEKVMRFMTYVGSRSEYDSDPEAAQRFYNHFQEFKRWANDQAK
ncbi:MAG: hypothetical protein V4629_03170 [Pseudomonadota bacterium]